MSDNVSAAEAVYQDVKERILTNVLAGGELISEGDIAGQLAVSRTPVREAFLRLEAQGWMRLYPKRGALITPIAADEVAQVMGARHLVESGAARSVIAIGAHSELADQMSRNIDQQRKVLHDNSSERPDGDVVVRFTNLDTDFHRAIVVAGENPILLNFYDTLRERQRRMIHSSLRRTAGSMEDVVAQHQSLTQCILDADPDGFSSTLAEHFRRVHSVTIAGVQ